MKDNFNLDSLKPKKRINSRTKGNKFENDVAKIFNERFCTEEFGRSPGSGAFGTTHKVPEYMRIHGDLITPRNFRFIIECKAGYEDKLKIADLLDENGLFSKFIKKAEEDSYKAFKEKNRFLLIVKQSRKDLLLFTPDSGEIPRFNPSGRLFLNTRNYSLIGIPLKEFLSVYGSEYFFVPELT